MITRFEIILSSGFVCIDNIESIRKQLKSGDFLVVLGSVSDYVLDTNVYFGSTTMKYDRVIQLESFKVYTDIYNLTTKPDVHYSNGIGPALQTGVSLVSCCMDRNSNLKICINSWLQIKDVTEIIIIDWNSTVPVKETLENIIDKRVKIYRVTNVGFWSASRAKTFAYQMSSCDKILLVDADDIINDINYLAKHQLNGRNFFCGSFYKNNMKIKNKTSDTLPIIKIGGRSTSNGMHLYGLHYVKRVDIIAVRGQNQYINTYGTEDEELFKRLEQHGLKREPINIDAVSHIDCPNSERVVNQAYSSHKLVAHLNKKIFNKIFWKESDNMCEYYIKKIDETNFQCTQIYVPEWTKILEDKQYLPLLRAGLMEYLMNEKMENVTNYKTIPELIKYGKKHIIPEDFDEQYYSKLYNTDNPYEHWLEHYNDQPIFINQARMDRYIERTKCIIYGTT